MNTKRIKQMIPLGVILLIFAGIIVFSPILRGDQVSKSKTSENEKVSEGIAPSGTGELNRLQYEKSPYLIQHADNPVDWWPWCDEAFALAKAESKPIFLSIGYSSCHWCHVMEHESFEDEEVAKILSKYFISIKLDREERPDIDAIYMQVCQMMTGSGGWPLSIFMTPDMKPFYAGTYIPRYSQYNRPGFVDLLNQIGQMWASEEDRARILADGDKVTQALLESKLTSTGIKLTEEELKNGFRELSNRFDPVYGGFGQAPKFPSPHNLSFLLRYWKRSGDKDALAMVEKTLDSMRRGGIYDQVGLGFARYSVDQQWLTPHFEKMLYDQAMLAIAYIEAYQVTGKEKYADIAREIFTYVLRDMKSPEGGFYSSENADSEGEEGKFYVWTKEEIQEVLGKKDAPIVMRFYGVDQGSNFDGGTNILYVRKSIENFAKEEKLTVDEVKSIIERSRQKLFDAREKRIRPSLEDKILTDWNGLMIAAFAKAAQALDEPIYAEAAVNAIDFILDEMRDENGRLLHRYRDGESAIRAFLDDYAFLTWGLLELYEATFDPRFLTEAITLADDTIRLFWDDEDKGFYFTGSDSEKLITRTKELYDGAIPSGNSVMGLNLFRLGRMTMNQKYDEKAHGILDAFGRVVMSQPSAFSQFLCTLDFGIGPTKEIVIAGATGDESTRTMIDAIQERFLPRKVLLFHADGDKGKEIEKLVPFIASQTMLDESATAYVCENFACKAPTSDLNKMLEYIETN